MCGEEGRRLSGENIGLYIATGFVARCRFCFVTAEALEHKLHACSHIVIVARPSQGGRYVCGPRDLGSGDQGPYDVRNRDEMVYDHVSWLNGEPTCMKINKSSKKEHAID